MADASSGTTTDPEGGGRSALNGSADVDRADQRDQLDQEIHGLDVLEGSGPPRRSFGLRAWSAAWPKLAAVTMALFLWQVVAWTGWRPRHVLPPPGEVFEELWRRLQDGSLVEATGITVQRAFSGFAMALLIGIVVGSLVAQVKVVRTAFGSFITGLQTMPSIAWFPLAILLFGLNEQAIFFVVVLGAAPSIANGVVAGVDQIPPLWLRAGRVLGARGFRFYRHVVAPAALPSFVAGLKQGWAFAWRSLMAGELLVVLANRPSLGQQLDFARQLNDADGLMAVMIAILVIGIVVDALFFGTLERSIRRRRGLIDT